MALWSIFCALLTQDVAQADDGGPEWDRSLVEQLGNFLAHFIMIELLLRGFSCSLAPYFNVSFTPSVKNVLQERSSGSSRGIDILRNIRDIKCNAEEV